jgi:hypothetical protein
MKLHKLKNRDKTKVKRRAKKIKLKKEEKILKD